MLGEELNFLGKFMKVLLMRHVMADSVEESKVEYDAMRPISEQGRRHCESVAKFIKGANMTPKAAICSPFRRAVETIEAMNEIVPCTYSPSSLIAPGCGVDDLLQALTNNCDECDDDWQLAVLHEPDVGYILGELVLAGIEFPFDVLPGNVYALDIDIVDQQVSGNIISYFSPVRVARLK